MTAINGSSVPRLRAIVSVEYIDRVQCGQLGCGHAVYRRIHVVQDGDELLVLGSTCFAKRYGSANALDPSSASGGDGRKLTHEQRQLLVNNTAALLAQFELERPPAPTVAVTSSAAKAASAHWPRSPASAPPLQADKASPWSWMKPMTSMIYFHLRDGSGWVRVQHINGGQMLMPWPTFEGWDEAFPGRLGVPDHLVGGLALENVVATIAYLRARAQWEKLSGSWHEIASEIARHKKYQDPFSP